MVVVESPSFVAVLLRVSRQNLDERCRMMMPSAAFILSLFEAMGRASIFLFSSCCFRAARTAAKQHALMCARLLEIEFSTGMRFVEQKQIAVRVLFDALDSA